LTNNPKKFILLIENQSNDARVSCKASFSFRKSIDFEVKFEEFEGSFERNELKETQLLHM
jgi:hypothetical protein